MKTFRMIGMALLAILLSVNLVSCDKDEDGTTGGGSGAATGSGVSLGNGKKLVRVLEFSDGGGELMSKTELKYDAQGRVVEADNKWKDYTGGPWIPDNIKYCWESNKVTGSWKGYNPEYEYMFAGGKVSKKLEYWKDPEDGDWNIGTYNFIYDKDGHIKEHWRDDEGEKCDVNTYTWNNGQLSLIEEDDEGEYSSEHFRYGNQTCKGFNPMLFLYVEAVYHDEYIFMAHPELIGIETTHLPAKSVKGDYTTTFEYELDSDGYVIGCTTRGTYANWGGSGSNVDYYEFVWE